VVTVLVLLGIRLSHIYSYDHFLSVITPQGNRFLVDENSFCVSCLTSLEIEGLGIHLLQAAEVYTFQTSKFVCLSLAGSVADEL
jgi:hypothetical protein